MMTTEPSPTDPPSVPPFRPLVAAGNQAAKSDLPTTNPENRGEHTLHLPIGQSPDLKAVLVVPETLIDPLPLVAATQQTLRALNPSPKVLLACTDKPVLEVRVSEPQLDRALRILDTVLKTAIARGDIIEICDAFGAHRHMGYLHSTPHERSFSTWIRRGDDAIRVHLEQDQQEVRLPDPPPPPEPPQPNRRRHYVAPWRPPPPPRYEWRTVSNLRLRIEFQYVGESFQQNWNSTEKRPLEGQLNRFFRELDKIFACLRPKRLAREEERRAKEESERRAEEQRQRVLAERRRVHDLHTRLRDWSTALRLREFIGTVEADFIARQGTIAHDSDLAKWLTWAMRYADGLRDEAVRTLPALRELPDPPPRPQAEHPNYSANPQSYMATQHWWQRR